ncbi:class A beta-lactamase-related serine hydrolase [Asanoa sp. WMMD1127]|uniref:serine hydrolase n=1 Tax=Asanoa sp. WMMD1127 TaxID=3016107 RepID=UPI0024180F58|nr:serine hydrolase [Asanoa sp. WMMD1127]MDG4826952.1 class A beta-lactamase-related serine hydrolase [Asanoa sp. WMMD1127]
MDSWDEVDEALGAAPGTAAAWVGPVGGPPAYARQADATHYAASTMKVGVLVALHRAAAAGLLDLDAPVAVHNRHTSAASGFFADDPAEDSDTATWALLGATSTLRDLARQMIVRSGNLATNLCLAAVGVPAAQEVWRLAGATHSVTARGIEDAPARLAGLDNLVTAGDLAALFGAVVTGDLLPSGAGREVLALLEANEHRDDLVAGLPAGTRVAHKNGWITGVRHGAGVVFPADAPPYTVVVCTSTSLPDEAACALVAGVSRAAWSARHSL